MVRFPEVRSQRMPDLRSLTVLQFFVADEKLPQSACTEDGELGHVGAYIALKEAMRKATRDPYLFRCASDLPGCEGWIANLRGTADEVH